MRNSALNPTQAARRYAFLLLKFRLRSEKEIYQRLKQKKFAPEIVSATLAFLKEHRFIDDELFAKAWVESRLKKPLGLLRLRQELKAKGIEKEIIEKYTSVPYPDYSEKEIVYQLVRERKVKLRGIDPQKARQRLYGYLLRRGFSPDIVIEAINRI